MLGWLFASPADRRLLGGAKLRGPMPWVIAIMSFSILIVAATGLALAGTAGMLTRSIEARYSVEVPNAGDKLEPLLAVVRSAPGVASAEAVPERAMRKTLERWLGPAAQSRELPVPALINFELRRGADLAAVQQRIAAAEPDAQVVAHAESIGPLLRSLRLLQWTALGLVLMLSAAAAAAVVLAARGALDTHRSTIEVMHGIGATDMQVTHLFQRRIALDALAGSVAGAVSAALLLFLLTTGAAFAGELTGEPALSTGDLAVLLVLPFALAMLATFVARTTVLSALQRAL